MSRSRRIYIEEIISETEPKPAFAKGVRYGRSTCEQVGSKVYLVGNLGQLRQKKMTVGVYDLQENSWQWVVDEGDHVPYPRDHTSFVANDRLYVHGGGFWLNDLDANLYAFDLITLEWTQCCTSSIRPSGRFWHTGQYLDSLGVFVFFGGCTSKRSFNGVWALLVDDLRWSFMKVKGTRPWRRRGHASCAVGETIFFYGGCSDDGDVYYDDLHLLDCSGGTYLWSEAYLKLGIYRAFGSLTYMNGELLLFGGRDENMDDSQDLFALSRPDFCPVKARNLAKTYPSKYNCHKHSTIVFSGDIYVFDGSRKSFDPLRISIM